MKYKILTVIAIVIGVLLTLGEIIADNIWGDGDGMITCCHIHKIIFTIQLIIIYFLAFKLIDFFYVKYYREKVSASSSLQQFGKIFIVLIIFFTCFFTLEITSRYFFPSEGAFDKLYPVENARKPFPYIMFKGAAGTMTGFGDEVYNSHGYRGSYPQIRKDSTEYRIIVTGGSAVWEGNPSIPQLLEEAFHKNGFTNTRVYNFGVVSSVSSMELSTIVNEISNLSPDLIVMYNGANDIIFPLKYDPRPGYPFNFLVYENNPFTERNYPAFILLAYKSNLLRLFFRNYFTEKFSKITELKKDVEYNSDKWKNEIATIYINNLKKAADITGSFQSKLFVFLQPTVYSKSNLSERELEFVKTHPEENKHLHLLRELILKKIYPSVTDTTGFYFSDLSSFYDANTEQVFRDDVHTLQEKKPGIAKKVFDEIMKQVQVKK